MRLRGLTVLAIATGLVCGTRVAEAQQPRLPIPQRLVAAKEQIVNLNTDSAGKLLESVLENTSGADGNQRSWAYALMALVRLADRNRSAAVLMFRQSLNSSPRLAADSLSVLRDLDSQAEPAFQEARNQYLAATGGAVAAPRDTLRVSFTVTPDTVLATEAVLPVTPRPTRPARSVVTVAAVGAPAGSILTSSDTLPLGSSGPLRVNLRRADGTSYVQTNQRYTFTLVALDSLGFQAQASWVMRAEIQRAVERPLPRDLSDADLRPETLQVKQRSAATLLGGAGLGVAAALLPTALGQAKLNSGLAGDGTAYVVAGSLTVAGIVGFLNGRRAVFSPEHAQFNANRRRVHEDSVQAVRTANQLAQQRPPIRLVMDRSPN